MDILLPPGGRGPGLCIAHPWWGVNSTIRAFGQALAGQGFVVALPDVFQGRTAQSIEDAQLLADTVWIPDAPTVLTDALKALAEHPAVTSERVAMVAFSMGGFFALGLAGRTDLPLAAIVTYYAARELPGRHVPILSHFSQSEPFDSNETLQASADALTRAGAPSAVHFYGGTRHWFAEADRPEYDAAAAQLAFERTVAFLRYCLQDQPALHE